MSVEMGTTGLLRLRQEAETELPHVASTFGLPGHVVPRACLAHALIRGGMKLLLY